VQKQKSGEIRKRAKSIHDVNDVRQMQFRHKKEGVEEVGITTINMASCLIEFLTTLAEYFLLDQCLNLVRTSSEVLS